MKFRFEFDIKRLPEPITHQHRLFMIGSCFTENIGEKFERYKFATLQNPHGILFNPASVADALIDYVDEKKFSTSQLFRYNEAWHSWKHHSRFSATTADEAVQRINASTQTAHAFLKDADYIFITLGSAWTYVLTSEATNATVGSVAANNHKAPATWFTKKLLSAEEVIAMLHNAMQRLLQFNSKLKFIFTISPVRHLREGAVENNRSKAVLITAVHTLVHSLPSLYYFPAYELVLDDLRDYRFFAEDLVHPNYFATQYVWERLVEACMSETTKTLMEELHAIDLAYHHKAFNPDSSQHKKFLQKFLEKASLLQRANAHINLQKEIAYFSAMS